MDTKSVIFIKCVIPAKARAIKPETGRRQLDKNAVFQNDIINNLRFHALTPACIVGN